MSYPPPPPWSGQPHPGQPQPGQPQGPGPGQPQSGGYSRRTKVSLSAALGVAASIATILTLFLTLGQQQPQPTPAPAGPTSGATNAYPADIQANFLASCETNGPAATCQCTLSWFERNVPLQRFEQDEVDVGRGLVPADLAGAQQACQ